MRTFFTSDLHLGHGNIIKYCNRPFRDADEMNRVLVGRWNEKVKPEDEVYVLGDFCFRSRDGANRWEDRLNGHKVFLRGNHDGKNGTKSLLTHGVIRFEGLTAGMCHDPAAFLPMQNVEGLDGRLWLVGHVHEKWTHRWVGDSLETLQMNVGVDVWDFRPALADDVFLRARQLLVVRYPDRQAHNQKNAENYKGDSNDQTGSAG